jgi:hypothetical protein
MNIMYEIPPLIYSTRLTAYMILFCTEEAKYN